MSDTAADAMAANSMLLKVLGHGGRRRQTYALMLLGGTCSTGAPEGQVMAASCGEWKLTNQHPCIALLDSIELLFVQKTGGLQPVKE